MDEHDRRIHNAAVREVLRAVQSCLIEKGDLDAERISKASPLHVDRSAFTGVRPQGWNQAIGGEGI